jgi:hypothetical protein
MMLLGPAHKETEISTSTNFVVQPKRAESRWHGPAKVFGTLLTCLSFAVASAAHAEKRVALVVGNSDYESAPRLNNPINDAKALAETLEGLGFVVEHRADLDRDQLDLALADFSDLAGEADWAVVYFSGHGIEVGGTNYLIPVDARLERESRVRFEAVPLDNVLAAVQPARQLRLVILDACRNNPFLNKMVVAGLTRSATKGLARPEPHAGTVVAYAAREHQLARDGDGELSPYVDALIHHLEQPGLEIGKVFREVRAAVLKATADEQEPVTYGTFPPEDLYLLPTRSQPLLSPDLAEWIRIIDSESKADFEGFIRSFPESRVRPAAEARLAALWASTVPQADAVASALIATYSRITTDEASYEAARRHGSDVIIEGISIQGGTTFSEAIVERPSFSERGVLSSPRVLLKDGVLSGRQKGIIAEIILSDVVLPPAEDDPRPDLFFDAIEVKGSAFQNADAKDKITIDRVYAVVGKLEDKLRRHSRGTIEGWSVPRALFEDEQFSVGLTALGYDEEELTINVAWNGTFERPDNTLLVQVLKIGLDGLGKGSLSGEFRGVPSLRNFSDPKALEKVLLDTPIYSLRIQYDDSSLIGRALDSLARQRGVSREEYVSEAAANLQAKLTEPELPAIAKVVTQIARSLLDDPRRVIVELDPDPPITGAKIRDWASTRPEALSARLNLTVASTPRGLHAFEGTEPEVSVLEKFEKTHTISIEEKVVIVAEGASLRAVLMEHGADEEEAARIQSALVANFSFDFRAGQKLRIGLAVDLETGSLRPVRVSLYQSDDRHIATVALSNSGVYVAASKPPLKTGIASSVGPSELPIGAFSPQSANRLEGLPGTGTPGDRAIYYYQGAEGEAGEAHEGTVTWSEITKDGNPAIRAVLRIPDRDVEASVTISENHDPKLPTSHLIEIEFRGELAESPIQRVPALVLKPTEQARGQPLAGAAVPVTNELFWIALSDDDEQVARNVQLLRDGSWFDLPILFSDHNRALISFEKSIPGDRVFETVMASWEAPNQAVSVAPETKP